MSRLNVANFRHPDGTDDNINLDSSGRVGVGETSPTHILHVTDDSQSLTGATLKLESSATTGAADTGPVIQFYGHSGSEPRYHSAIKGAKENGTSGNTAGYLAFATRPAGGAMAEQARITSDGEFRFNSGYGSVATAYGVRAWVNFNGTGTVAIRSSGNVSSITDNATGNYTVNFTNSLPDDDYCYFGGIGDGTSTSAVRSLTSRRSADSFSQNFHQFGCVLSGNTLFDPNVVSIAFVR